MSWQTRGADKVRRDLALFLIYTESVNDVLPRRHNRRNNTRYHGEQQTEANEDEGVQGVEVQERADAGDCFDDYGHDGTENVGDENAYEPACESDDRSFGDKDVANILLSCADCTENTDFTSTLDDGV